ncbi:class F sortase [Actinacidiphila acididurans]|uniref:Class F sortase n=1 Tax=Actinacidiphila acididurans TaxID=2784346 RepID=A0ABS2TW15_9ACTN|nr:class F sortase [Actinacidiphila acididurans]MBM9506153.1 class F sortase [Actinacidiphila acididurans]
MHIPAVPRIRPRLVLLLLALPLSALLIGCGGGRTGTSTPANLPPAASSTARPTPGTAEAMPPSVPVRVTIPAAGVDTGPLLRLGLNTDGTLQVPSTDRADRIGWYTGAVTPGQIGPAILVGHLDSVNGPAVMRNVTRIKPGDRITVLRADGTRAIFSVTRLQQVDKAHFPTGQVYGDTDSPQLRLITCGGTLTHGHHPDDIIVYAALAGRQ